MQGGVWEEAERCGWRRRGGAEPEETLMSRGRRPSCTSAPRKTGEKSEFRALAQREKQELGRCIWPSM